MARSLGNTIADSLQLSLSYGERLLAGIEPDRFARLATPGNVMVGSNHPAFIYGHLSLYSGRIIQEIDRGDLDASVPDDFEQLFGKEQSCLDDPDGSIYPAMDVVVSAYQRSYAQVVTALREVSDGVLQQANPLGGRMTELFPTLGSLHNFYTGGHMMIHFGQLSAWRRMEGLGPA